MSENKSLLRHGPVYVLASLLNRGAGLLLVLLYTRLLGESGYGLVGAALAVAEVAGVLLSLQLADAVARIWFDARDERGQRDVLATAWWSIVGLMAALSIPLWVLAPTLSRFATGDAAHVAVVLVAIYATGTDALFNAMLAASRARMQSGAVLGWSGVRTVCMLGSAGILVGWLRCGPVGALAAILIGNSLAALALAWWELRRGGRFRVPVARALIAYGAPLCPAYLGESTAKLVERAAIVASAGLTGAGWWFLALRLADVLTMVVHGPFAQVWSVRRLELHRDGKPDPEGSRTFLSFAALMLWGALSLALLAPEVIAIAGGAGFASAAEVLPAAAIAAAVFALCTGVDIRLQMARRSRSIAAAACISAVIHAGLAWQAALWWGLLGAAGARVAATLVRLACFAVAARRCPGPKMPWLQLVVLASMCVTGMLLGHGQALGWRIALMALYPAIVLLARRFGA